MSKILKRGTPQYKTLFLAKNAVYTEGSLFWVLELG
jgi:hypothetical protein